MATLTLTQAWVNLLPTGESVSGWTLRNRDWDAEVDGEIHKYAAGRFRAVSEEGTRRSFDFTLVRLTLSQVETLESWLGRTVQVRTHNGLYLVGAFFSVGTTEYMDGLYAANIAIRSVTQQEVLVG